MPSSAVIALLRKIDIFEQLPEPELIRVAKLLKERRFREEQVLFKQGDPGDSLFLIARGRVKIFQTDSLGTSSVLAFLSEGDFFGDMAVLTGAPRSGTAQAATEVRVFELRKEDLDVLLSSNVAVMKEMLRVMAERQASVNQRVSQEAGAEAGEVIGSLTVVFSPRGGSGKTTIATNLAVALAQEAPDRVVLLDLALLFGQVSVLLDLNPRTSLAAISAGVLAGMDREMFAHYSVKHEESALRIMVGALRPEEGERVSAEHVRQLLHSLLKQFVHVVVDTSPNFDEPTLAAVEMADRVLLVCTPDPAALRDIGDCRRVFVDVLGVPATRFQYVFNQTTPYSGITGAAVSEAGGRPLFAQLPFGGDGPARSALEGRPLVTARPTNPASKGCLEMAKAIEKDGREKLVAAAG